MFINEKFAMPCPFCESDDLMVAVDGYFSTDDSDCWRTLVCCTNCESTGPKVYGTDKTEEAIDAWNRAKR